MDTSSPTGKGLTVFLYQVLTAGSLKGSFEDNGRHLPLSSSLQRLKVNAFRNVTFHTEHKAEMTFMKLSHCFPIQQIIANQLHF